MTTRSRRSIILCLFVGVCLLVGMLVGSFVIAGTLVKVKRNDVLSVTGAASQLIESDHASWSASICSTRTCVTNAFVLATAISGPAWR